MTDRVPGTKWDYDMVMKGPEEQDKVEEHCNRYKDFGLYAKTRVLNSRVTWSVMQLKNIISDSEGRKEQRWTGTHAEIAGDYGSSPSKRLWHFYIGGGSTQTTVIMHIIF